MLKKSATKHIRDSLKTTKSEKKVAKAVVNELVTKEKNAYKKVPHGILSEFPARKFCKLEYSVLDTLTTGVVLDNFGTEVVYLLGGLYQPRLTGTSGYRPQGYNQMIVAYNKWRVHGVKISLEFFNPSQDGINVAAQLQSSTEGATITGTKLGTYKMKKWAWSRFISPSGSQRVTKKYFVKNRSIEGMNKAQYEGNDVQFSGSAGANPTLSGYIRIAAVNEKDTTNATVSCLVKLEYYVQFYDRNILPSST